MTLNLVIIRAFDFTHISGRRLSQTLQYTNGDLISYVQRSGKIPPIELIKKGQQKIDDRSHLEITESR